MNVIRFNRAFEQLPIIAILRGLKPENAAIVGETLTNSGIAILEVPLNSPEPLESIRILRETLSADVVIGAGTVTEIGQVDDVKNVGGEIILSPNMDTRIIRASVENGLVSIPGVATVTEAFTAIQNGANMLKVFPAVSVGLNFFKQVRAVLPADAPLLAVGGVDTENLKQFIHAGAVGAGIGSALFSTEKSVDQLNQAGLDFVKCTQEAFT